MFEAEESELSAAFAMPARNIAQDSDANKYLDVCLILLIGSISHIQTYLNYFQRIVKGKHRSLG